MAKYSQIQNYIDNLKIRDKEYDIIMNTLENADPRFFVKILEEVVDREMFWIDLYPLFDTNDYRKSLASTLQTQEEIAYEISNLTKFTENIINSSSINKLGITKSHDNYENIENDERRQKLYDLLQIKTEDDTFTIACKSAILNSILNFEIVSKSMSDNNMDNDIHINTANELIRPREVEEGKEYLKYDYFNYLNPDDILITADDMIIPIDSRYQVLNDSDIVFMNENNMSENQMKHFKALAMFLEQSYGGAN